MENNTLCNRHSLGVNNHTKMYVTYTRIYGWSDYGGESSYQPGYRLENMMWMTLLVYDYIIPGEKMSKSKYQENLIKTVMDKSWGNTWEEAVQEWDIIDCAEDNSLSRSCICGKEQIKYLYRLHNRKTNQWLFPIGSSCIKKFQRKDLQEKTATTEAMFKLLHAVGNNQYLQLSSDLFSRKLLKELYDQGAFKATSYNHYNPKNDYDFLLKMFNKRTKNSISTLQQKKITAILLNSIKPFLEQKLRSQIMS